MKQPPSHYVPARNTKAISLRVGMYLTDGGHRYRIDLKTENGWVVRQIETNETRTSPTDKLIEAIQAGELREVGPSGSDPIAADSGQFTPRLVSCAASPAALKAFAEQKQWIDALHAEGYSDIADTVWIRSTIDRLAKTTLASVRQYKISTLRRLEAKVRKAGGDWTAAVPRYLDRGGRGQTRTDPRAERIIQEALDIEKGRQGRFVRSHVIDAIRAKVLELNQSAPDDPIRMPGDSTVQRRIATQFTKYELRVRNSGRKSANRLYRENSYPRDRAQYPLEISEYDDIDCGVFLVNERSGLPAGRAFLTHGICNATGVPLGFDLSHRPRSFDSAVGAICSSLLPKDPNLPEFGELANDWIGYGVQGTILLDNARYNHSKSTAIAAADARLALAGTRPYGPTEKSSIEHYNFLVKRDFCSALPGWRGDKNDPESVKQGLSSSCIDIVTFKALYVRWVTGVYLKNPGSDGRTPRQRWERHYRLHGPAVRWSREQIALLRLRPMELTFRDSGGVKRLGLVYNSEVVRALRRKEGHNASVLAYVDNEDLSYLFVRHPETHELLRADFVDDHRHVQGLNAYQQKLILRLARERGIKNPSLIQLAGERERLRQMVEQARRSHKLQERRYAERVGDIPTLSADFGVEVVSDFSEAGVSRPVKKVMTDLEWSIVQLEQVELTSTDEEW